jgi:hypothetical protein
VTTGRFNRSHLIDQAIASTGEDDFGEPTWLESLELLLDSLQQEARLNDLGVEIATSEITAYLTKRLSINAWRRSHSEVADGTVTRPIFIVGQPRTGTTILYDLLAQDPGHRAPLTWEVDRPVPPPESGTYESDPRIGEVQATIDMAESIIPGFTTFHPIGALLGQECVRITACDFRSMIFPTQYRVPTYNRWLLRDADLGPAYRWHRRYLQHLQSRHPAEQWLLKSPAHLWHLNALVAEYPDAVVIQTHRDPLKVIASVSALTTHLRGMASDDTSIVEVASDYAIDIFLGLDRCIDARNLSIFAPDHVIDIHFAEFVSDPLSAIKRIYGSLDRKLTERTEERMRTFLASHPGDGDGAGVRYRFGDTGLDPDTMRERSTRYQERFGVASESVL